MNKFTGVLLLGTALLAVSTGKGLSGGNQEERAMD